MAPSPQPSSSTTTFSRSATVGQPHVAVEPKGLGIEPSPWSPQTPRSTPPFNPTDPVTATTKPDPANAATTYSTEPEFDLGAPHFSGIADASLTQPWASPLVSDDDGWTDNNEREDDGGMDDGDDDDDETEKAVRIVNECIESIGMGRYQYKLFVLCGFGWLADNMWLQGISVAIPGMQRTFNVPDAWMGLGTSSAFIGMMIGAGFWGPISDSIGRRPAFTLTLLITVLFGGAAAFASSFQWYCAMLIGMGIGVGGNLPVDGALFLEFVPPTHQSLLTLLSLFWPVGQLVSSTVAWILIPTSTCDPSLPCTNPNVTNRGWRRLLLCLALITLAMLIGRVVLFRMLESPKFLVSRGKLREAVEVLKALEEENGKKKDSEGQAGPVKVAEEALLRLKGDGVGVPSFASAPKEPSLASPLQNDGPDSTLDLLPNSDHVNATPSSTLLVPSPTLSSPSSTNDRRSSAASTLVFGLSRRGSRFSMRELVGGFFGRGPMERVDEEGYGTRSRRRGNRQTKNDGQGWEKMMVTLKKQWEVLFGDELRRTTILVWIIWSLISCGYTMFNGFLAKFLGSATERPVPPTPDETFRDIFIISIMGIPGSIIGMYLIDTSLGRRGSMALSAFGTAASLFLFTLSTKPINQLIASCLAAVLQNIMYGVLYSYTPEVFGSQVRGTATGIASSLSRVFGTMAPILTGTLLTVSVNLPLYVSSLLIFLSAVAMVWLPIETRGRTVL
ncbi:hypothetical protein HDU97_006643 [Phlyctochytrium planicorne]|nr:hypothetical protein HDU97_006643 [Phlyctochytrium planicorne]